jgi:beta-lactamase regulating signal transducer with metallopeptidase domain
MGVVSQTKKPLELTSSSKPNVKKIKTTEQGVEMLLSIGVIADRLLANKVAWQDLAWRLTLLAVLILPLFSFIAGASWPAGLVQLPVLAAHSEIELVYNKGSLVDASTTEQPDQGSDGLTDLGQSHGVKQQNKKVDSPKETSTALSPIFSWWKLATAFWLLGSLWFLVRFVMGWRSIRLIASDARKANNIEPAGWSDAIDQATVLAGLSSRIVVRASDKISTPMLVGVMRPLVLVPESMLQLSPTDARVQAALSHEAMHIRRGDSHWNFMLFVCLIIWWPIPMVHWMKRRIVWLRELLCDASVAVGMGAADYAESLLKLTETPHNRRMGVLAIEMLSREQSLESRVAWILEMSNSVPNPSRSTRRVAWSCLVVALLGFTTVKLVPANSPSAPIVSLPAAEVSENESNENEVELRGVVKNSQGKPVANAIVYLRWNDGDNRLPRKTLNTTTDDEGRYAFSTDLPGPYRIWAEGDGLTSLKKFLRGTRITVEKDQTGPIKTDLTVEKACDYNVSIISAETKEAIEGAKISFGWTDIKREYTTGMDGVASIRGLAVNDWYFVVKAEGYATFFKKTAPQALGTTTELTYELKRGVSAEVDVRDQNGDPVVGAGVGLGYEEISMVPDLIPYPSRTNADGKLLIKGLPINTKLRLGLGLDGYKFSWKDGKFEVDGSKELEKLTFVGEKLPYGGDAEFEVKDENGQPIAGATLKNPSSSSGRYRETTTDMGGTAWLSNLYGRLGKKYVIIKAPGMIPQRLDIEPGPKDDPKLFQVTLKAGKTLTGVVLTPEGKPAPVNTRVYFNEGEHTEWNGGSVTTRAGGKFTINGLEDSATITVYTPEQYEPIEDLKFDVVEGKEVEIRMTPAAVLRIRAIDEATGEPIPEFNVRLGHCKARLDGDRRGNGILSTLVNPGVNVHGTKKEYRLGHQFAGAVYKVIVSAKGYQTKTIERMQTVVESESKLHDIALTKE